MKHRRHTSRLKRVNPWSSAKPASWNSMTRQERKAWNRANWRKGGGSSAPKPEVTRYKAAGYSKPILGLTPKDVRKLSESQLLHILNHPEHVSEAVYAAADIAFNGNE